ncbi:MAG: aminopeptidase P N-terminal domain-containing protein, partial [Candidatus Cryptobacteroides sp.]
MFDKSIYSNRRRVLAEKMAGMLPEGKRGIALFVGNAEAPQNYRGNDYKFRQDSSFLYYWGIDEPLFAAVLDLDNGDEYIFGDDVDIEDIIWMGPQDSVASKAERVGVAHSAPYKALDAAVEKAL